MANAPTQDTIIAQGVRLEGDFVSQGDVIIEGEVNGSIQTTKDLKIGESALIQADVVTSNAIVAGEIRGNISAKNQLNLTETSKVHGDIAAKILTVAPGAQINGRVAMENGSAEVEEKPKAPRATKAKEDVEVEEK